MTVSCLWISGMRNCLLSLIPYTTRVVTGDCLLVPWKHTSTPTVPEPLQLHTFLWGREAAFYELSSAIKTSLLSRSVSCRLDLSWGLLEYPTCRKGWPPLTSDPCQLRVNFSLVPLAFDSLESNEWKGVGVCTLYGQNCMLYSFLESCYFEFPNAEILDKGWASRISKISWISCSQQLYSAQQLPALVFVYRLSGHCSVPAT